MELEILKDRIILNGETYRKISKRGTVLTIIFVGDCPYKDDEPVNNISITKSDLSGHHKWEEKLSYHFGKHCWITFIDSIDNRDDYDTIIHVGDISYYANTEITTLVG